MKKIIVFFLLTTSLISGNLFCQDFNPIHVDNYQVTAEYRSEKSLISVSANLDIISNSGFKDLYFQMKQNVNVNSVKIIRNESERLLKFNNINNDSIEVNVFDNVENAGRFNLIFDYEIPVEVNIVNSIVLYYWYPFINHDLSKWKLEFSTDNNYIVFASGLIGTSGESENKKEEYVFFQQKPIPHFQILIGVKNYYRDTSLTVNNITLDYHFVSTDKEVVNNIIQNTSMAFQFYDSLIGNYNYNQLDFVEVPGQLYVTSMPSIVFIGSLFVDKYNNGLNEWEAHEVAHQWFGSGMFANFGERGNSCVFEPMAEYLKIMFWESKFGEKYYSGIMEKYKSEYDTSIFNTNKDKEIIDANSSYRVVYLKGPIILNNLRVLTGEDTWNKMIRYMYSNYREKFFTYEDFKKCISNYDTQDTFVKFYDEWMNKKGLP